MSTPQTVTIIFGDGSKFRVNLKVDSFTLMEKPANDFVKEFNRCNLGVTRFPIAIDSVNWAEIRQLLLTRRCQVYAMRPCFKNRKNFKRGSMRNAGAIIDMGASQLRMARTLKPGTIQPTHTV